MRHWSKLTPTKNQIAIKKLCQMDEKNAKNCHLYPSISQKIFSMSKSHSLNAAHEQQFFLAQKKLVHSAILLG